MENKNVREKGKDFVAFKKAWENEPAFREEVLRICQSDAYYVNQVIRLYLIVRATSCQDKDAVVFLKKFYEGSYGWHTTEREVGLLRFLATKYKEADDFLKAVELGCHTPDFRSFLKQNVPEDIGTLWRMIPDSHREAMAKALLFLSMLERNY